MIWENSREMLVKTSQLDAQSPLRRLSGECRETQCGSSVIRQLAADADHCSCDVDLLAVIAVEHDVGRETSCNRVLSGGGG